MFREVNLLLIFLLTGESKFHLTPHNSKMIFPSSYYCLLVPSSTQRRLCSLVSFDFRVQGVLVGCILR